MIVYPNAKINLGLRVLNKRPDGFHNLETVFYPVALFDILEIVPLVGNRAGRGTLIQLYGIPLVGKAEDNLCIRAYNLLKRDFDLPPVGIYLHKNIPSGAGMGGGSSDAAFTLRALNELFSLNLSSEVLAGYAVQLGSDCAFFIYNRPMLGTGRGEILSPIEVRVLKDYKIKMVFPPFFVSTADAYKGIVPRDRRSNITEGGGDDCRLALPELLMRPVESWRNFVVNDFEETVFARRPELAVYKQQLYCSGALYASMSGSGSAMYGVFKR
jgi:4-diphosphocytidyl-2-C-methyl-D-erythritol kinase